MNENKDLTAIVVPCFNEEGSIDNVLNELKKNSSGNYFVIVVNDASEDNTSMKVREFSGVTLLEMPVNLGVGTSFQTGLIKALKEKCNYTVKLDGDGQHPAEYISDLLEPLKQNQADIVIGSRFLGLNTSVKISVLKKIGIFFLKTMIRILTGERITDPTSGFRAYNLKAMKFMSEFCPNFDYHEPEELILAKKNGLRIKEVNVNMRARKTGVSSISALGSVFYMVRVMLSMVIIFMRKSESWDFD